MTQILTKDEAFKDDQYILATQVKQCFYLEDMARRPPHWKVVEHVNHKKFSDGGVIVVEEDPDVIHFDNSSDLLLSTSLNDLNNATLHIDGQSTEMLHEATTVTVVVMIVPLHTIYPPAAGVASLTEETRHLGLKKITDDKGPVTIWFEWDDKKTMMPLGEHASHWSNYLGELIMEMPLYYPSWQKVPAERKATILTKIERWTDINAGIQQHLQKLYNTNKASLKAAHWIGMPRSHFGMIPGTKPEQLKIAKTGQRARLYADKDPGHLLAFKIRCVYVQMESSATREYLSLIHTFFVTHTVNGIFTRDEDRAIYDEMLRLQALGSNTPSGVPYTEEEINALARKGKQRGHFPGVGRVLSGRSTDVLILRCRKAQKEEQYESTPEFDSGSDECGDDEMADDEDDGEDEEDEEDGDNEYPQRYVAREGLKTSLGTVIWETNMNKATVEIAGEAKEHDDENEEREIMERVAEMIEMETSIYYTCDPRFMPSWSILMANHAQFLKAFRNSSKLINILGYGMVSVEHLYALSPIIPDEAFDLKMKLTSYWKVVSKRLVDCLTLELFYRIRLMVDNEIEHEIFNEVVENGDGIKKAMAQTKNGRGFKEASTCFGNQEKQCRVQLLMVSTDSIWGSSNF
ncbi:hypothetical protein Tco_0748370 [Tanacetum coccineum]|uniref:Uncharacterized protein n=1 Tax=Tanacetum coccineum TaxID=301880 RepID=A0ABQ4YVG2_9ASTR